MQPHAEINWVLLPSLPGPFEGVKDWFRGLLRQPIPATPVGDDLWDSTRALYAFFHPRNKEALYVGKAWGATVYQRFTASDKNRVFDAIRSKHSLAPISLTCTWDLWKRQGKHV
ncbi:MAG: hypothetical protein QM783_11130 [Phycisphaerales bacterium]